MTENDKDKLAIHADLMRARFYIGEANHALDDLVAKAEEMLASLDREEPSCE